MRSGSVTVGDDINLLNNSDNTGVGPNLNSEGNDEQLGDEEEIANFNRALGIPSPGLPKDKKKDFAKARARSQSILVKQTEPS